MTSTVLSLRILGVAILILVANQAYASFTECSVTVNRTIDLPIPVKPLYPSTTFTDKGNCGYDAITVLGHAKNEATKNPTMFKSDLRYLS